MIIGAIVQARMGSTRLPGKVLLELLPGWRLLDLVVGRARRAQRLGGLTVATGDGPADDPIAEHCRARGVDLFRGSETDVLGRMAGAARAAGLDLVVRLTGDNPLIDPHLIDDLIDFHLAGGFGYSATTMMGHSRHWRAERSFPRGVSIEVIDAPLLHRLDAETEDAMEREHVTLGVYDRPAPPCRLGDFQAIGDYLDWNHPELRLTVDSSEDLELTRKVFAIMGSVDPVGFSTLDAIRLLVQRPDLRNINSGVRHNVVSEIRGF